MKQAKRTAAERLAATGQLVSVLHPSEQQKAGTVETSLRVRTKMIQWILLKWFAMNGTFALARNERFRVLASTIIDS